METPKEYMTYLGDGVYGIFDGYGIWLHANDHKDPTDRIYLEPSVLKSLNNFSKQCELFAKKNVTNKEQKGQIMYIQKRNLKQFQNIPPSVKHDKYNHVSVCPYRFQTCAVSENNGKTLSLCYNSNKCDYKEIIT